MDAKTSVLDILIQAITLVSLDYEGQLKALPGFVNVPDEIALNFYDAFLLADQLVKAGSISDDQFRKIMEINSSFEMESKKKDSRFWTNEGLHNDPKWEILRKTTKDLLVTFGNGQQQRNLKGLSFIPGRKD